jgi:hypothetical protein
MSPRLRVAWRQSSLRIIRVHPPFRAPYDQHTVQAAPAHDPVRARAVVAGLSTVASVAEELEPLLRRDDTGPLYTDDLDLVTVGCWGGIVQISDPAFGEDGVLSSHLDAAFTDQITAHPEASITAVCEMYSAESYGKYLAHVPGLPRLSADGWDDQDTTGNLADLLRATGTASPDSDEDDAPYIDAEALDPLAGGLHSVYADEPLLVSRFRVTRTEDVREALDDVWLED